MCESYLTSTAKTAGWRTWENTTPVAVKQIVQEYYEGLRTKKIAKKYKGDRDMYTNYLYNEDFALTFYNSAKGLITNLWRQYVHSNNMKKVFCVVLRGSSLLCPGALSDVDGLVVTQEYIPDLVASKIDLPYPYSVISPTPRLDLGQVLLRSNYSEELSKWTHQPDIQNAILELDAVEFPFWTTHPHEVIFEGPLYNKQLYDDARREHIEFIVNNQQASRKMIDLHFKSKH